MLNIDNYRKNINYKPGFTLIELLVVISIIAILMAVMMPALGKARESAKSIVCRSNLKQMGIGIVNYNQDNDNRMPPSWKSANNNSQQNNWMPIIAPYLSEEDPSEKNWDEFWDTEVAGKKVYMCPSFKLAENSSSDTNQYNYVMNLHLSWKFNSDGYAWVDRREDEEKNWRLLRSDQIKDSDSKVLLSDGAGYHVEFHRDSTVLALNKNASRHSGKSNVLTASLSVSQDFDEDEKYPFEFSQHPNIFPF